MTEASNGFIRAGTLAELRKRGRVVLGTPGGAVLVLADGDDVVALDNRCPHMGFPLHRGSIEDGILTCHWHHARFDLRRLEVRSVGPTTCRCVHRASSTARFGWRPVPAARDEATHEDATA
jgi:nitrite reductase/ring-hydroxylating ferredoxin subunit